MATLREMAELAASRGLTREEFDRRMRRLGILNTSTASPETVIAQGAVDMATAPRTQSTTDTFDPRTLAATGSDPLTFDKPAVFSAVRELPKAPEPEPEFQPQPVQPAPMPQPSMPEQPQMSPEQAIQLQRQFERGVPFATDVEQQLQAQQAPQLLAAPEPQVEPDVSPSEDTYLGLPATSVPVAADARRVMQGEMPIYTPARLQAFGVRAARLGVGLADRLYEFELSRQKALREEEWNADGPFRYTSFPLYAAGYELVSGEEPEGFFETLTKSQRERIDAEMDARKANRMQVFEDVVNDLQMKSEGRGFWGTLGNAAVNAAEELPMIVGGIYELLDYASGGGIPEEWWYTKPSEESVLEVLSRLFAPTGLMDITNMPEDGSAPEQGYGDDALGVLVKDADETLGLYGNAFVEGLAGMLTNPGKSLEAYPFSTITTVLPFARALGIGKLGKISGEAVSAGLDMLEGTGVGGIVNSVRNLDSRLNRYTSNPQAFRDPQAVDLAERVIRQPVETEQAMLNISRQAEDAARLDEAELMAPSRQQSFPDPDPEAGATAGYDFGVREYVVDQRGNVREAAPDMPATVKMQPERKNLPPKLVEVIDRVDDVFGDETGVLGDAGLTRQAIYDSVQAAFDPRLPNALQVRAVRQKVLEQLEIKLEPFFEGNKSALDRAVREAGKRLDSMVKGQSIDDMVFRVKRQQPRGPDGNPIIQPDGTEVVLGDAVISLVDDVMLPVLSSDAGFQNLVGAEMAGVALRRASQKARINTQQRALAEAIAIHSGISDPSQLSIANLREVVGARGVVDPAVEIRRIVQRYDETGDLPVISRNSPDELLKAAESLDMDLPAQVRRRLDSSGIGGFDSLTAVDDATLQAVGLQPLDATTAARTARPSQSMTAAVYDKVKTDGSFTTKPGLFMYAPLNNALRITSLDKGWAQVNQNTFNRFWQRLTPLLKANAVPLNSTSIGAAYIGNIITGTMRHGPGFLAQASAAVSDYGRFKRGLPTKTVPAEFFEAITASDVLDSSFVRTEVLGPLTPDTPTGLVDRITDTVRFDRLAESAPAKALGGLFDAADSASKLAESWINYQAFMDDFSNLSPGRSIQMEISPNEMIAIRRTQDGGFEIASRTGRSKRGVGRKLSDAQFNALVARASAQPAARSFVNFNNLPMAKTWIRTQPLIDGTVASPFSGWTAGTQTTPWRFGLVGELVRGGALRGGTNDPLVAFNRLKRDATSAVTRGAAYNMILQQSGDEDAALGRIISYTGDPQAVSVEPVGGRQVKVTDLSSSDPTGDFSLLLRLLTRPVNMQEVLGTSMVDDEGRDTQPARMSERDIRARFSDPEARAAALRLQKQMNQVYTGKRRPGEGFDSLAMFQVVLNLAGFGVALVPKVAMQAAEVSEQEVADAGGAMNYYGQMLLDYGLPGTIQQILTAADPAGREVRYRLNKPLLERGAEIQRLLRTAVPGSDEQRGLLAERSEIDEQLNDSDMFGAAYSKLARTSDREGLRPTTKQNIKVRPDARDSARPLEKLFTEALSAMFTRETFVMLDLNTGKAPNKLKKKMGRRIGSAIDDINSVVEANIQSENVRAKQQRRVLGRALRVARSRGNNDAIARLSKEIAGLSFSLESRQRKLRKAEQDKEKTKKAFKKAFDTAFKSVAKKFNDTNKIIDKAAALNKFIQSGFTEEEARRFVEQN